MFLTKRGFILKGAVLAAGLLLVAGCDRGGSRVPLSAPAVVIDVRTPEEFAEGHIPGALSMPLDRIVPLAGERNYGCDRTLLLYCRSGKRAARAKEELEKVGFTDVHILGGMGDASKKLGVEPVK